MAIRTRILGAAFSLLMVAIVAWGTVAHAQVATTYSSNKRTLKVGILLLDSTDIADGRGPENPDPFIFYIADARADLKPQNWEFINPLSPKVVTSDIATRWTNRTGGNGEQYQAGQQVTKNMAAYWEVSLTDTPIQDLLQFDLLFITNHRNTKLTAADREKLRKLVDAGGVLWIEDCGGMRMDPTGPLFLDNLQFSGNGVGGSGFPYINVPTHPILNTPNPLSPAEIANLGDKNYGNYALVSLSNPTAAPNPEVLVNIVGNRGRTSPSAPNGLPYIAAGTYGSGRVIATAGDSGCDINDYAGGLRTPSGGNSGAYCGENLITAHAEDLKFLYNVVTWGSANSQYRKDPRRTGSSFEAIGAPLISAFQVGALDALSSTTAPLVTKGIVYSTGLSAVGGVPSVRAYSAHPSLVTGDVGIQDLSLGKSHDEIWRWDGAGGMPSSPALGTVYDPSTGLYGDFIFVTLSNGTLVKLTALLTDNSGNVLPAPLAAANAPVTSGTYVPPPGAAPGWPAPAPVFHDGKLYVVEPDGLVRCVDAATMQTIWFSYTQTQDPIYHPTASPSLGYTRLAITSTTASSGRIGVAASASGSSNDLMLYVPVWQVDANGNNVQRTMAYWLGARHEVVLRDETPGNFRTRAAQGAPTNSKQYVARTPGMLGNPALSFLQATARVYTNSYDGGGNLIYTAQDNMNAGRASTVYAGRFIDEKGIVRVEDAMGNAPSRGTVGPGSTPDNALVSVDYDVYYATTAVTPPALSNPQSNAARPTPGMSITGFQVGGDGIAMTPDDILVSAFKYASPSSAGMSQPHTSIAGDYEQYGLTRLRQSLGIFEIPGGLQALPLTIQNQVVIERPTLRNILQFSPLSAQQANRLPTYEGLIDVKPVGPPVTTNDGIVYQVLDALSTANGGRVTVVAALDMKKEVVLHLPKAYNPAYAVQVSQLNIATFDPTKPDQPQLINAALPPTGNNPISVGQSMVGDATRGRIVMTDMRAGNNRFSSALSFVVTFVPVGGTSTETVVVTPTPFLPNTGPGSEVDQRGLPVNGNYSPLLWYYVLPGQPTSAVTLSGDVLYLGISSAGVENIVALDAEPTSNDPGIIQGQQVESVVKTLGITAQKLDHVRWIRQVIGVIGGAPVGSQGTLAVNTSLGTQAFEAGVTLITDAKRILEVDASGAALWSIDGTMAFKIAGGQLPIYDPAAGTGVLNPATATGRALQERKSLSRPSLARRLSPSDYLICDTGNNRVVRVDRGGQVRWELTQLNDLLGVLTSVDPTTLNAPTDVQIYTVVTPGPGGPLGYEIHYLIADAGNNRIVEVADYFDTAGNVRSIPVPSGGLRRGEQVVVWVSRTTQKEGRFLRFQSLQRVLTFGDTRLGQNSALYGYPTILAAVGNSSTAGDSGGDTRSDFTGGSLVSLVYNPLNTAVPLFNNGGTLVTTVYPWFWTPADSPTEPLGKEPLRNGLIDRTLNEIVMPNGQVRRITRPSYIQQITLPRSSLAAGTSPKPAFLLCDASGVYQVELDPIDSRWYVTWYFSTLDYRNMVATRLAALRPLAPLTAQELAGIQQLEFQPTAIKRMATGDYLITNGWVGANLLFASGQFVGEVFQVGNERRYTYDAGHVATLDPLSGATPLFSGFSAPNLVLANGGVRWEQKMGSASSNTNLLEHPLFGDRL